MPRGLLLTSFGFSVFGVKGAQVATASVIQRVERVMPLAGWAVILLPPSG
jgi:hypothetical protein